MSSRALVYPTGSLAHLDADELTSHPELEALARLGADGVDLGVVVLPAAIEDAYYRLNNLPQRLAALYQGVDPTDPDEDLIEEAAPQALRLLATSYLLDDLIDAVYASIATLPARVEVRRPGLGGVTVERGREALLAVKRLLREPWTTQAVLARLVTTGHLGVDAAPVILHDAEHATDAAASARATAVLGRRVQATVDARGRVVGLSER